MIEPTIRRDVHRGRRGAGTPGYSLIEAMVAMVMMSVLITIGLPQFQLSLEQAKANVAWANLRSIWSAQRLYWLENRTYATDLATLQGWIPEGSLLPLVDPSLPTSTSGSVNVPYTYQVSSTGDGSATATRVGSSTWTGSFTIAADGSYSGSVQQSGQVIVIGPSFQ